MNQATKSEQLKVQTSDRYDAHEWNLDLKTQQFSCSEEAQLLLFGSVSDSINAASIFKYIPTNQVDIFKSTFKSVLETGEEQRFRCCLHSPHYIFSYLEFFIQRVSDTQLSGTVRPYFILRTKSEVAEVFQAVFDSSHHSIVVADEKTRIVACNSLFEENSGYKLNEVLGLKTSMFNANKLSPEFYREMWEALNDKGAWKGTILTRSLDGTVYPQDMAIQQILSSRGEKFYIAISSDLSNQLERIDNHESGGIEFLTQLPTKQSFSDSLDQEIEQMSRFSGLIVLAVQPGFSGSIEVKRQFASYLRESTAANFSGYIGQDSFLVCVRYLNDQSEPSIRHVGKAIKQFFHSFKHAQLAVGKALREGIVGVSVWNVDAKTPSKLVSHAYQALLELHSGKEHRINFFDRTIHNQLTRKKRLEEHVLACLSEKNVNVHYQPIVDTRTQKIAKFEALCRFPELEDLPATTQELIAIVEDLNKIVELDDVICRLAFSKLAQLQSLFGQEVGLSVNRSFNTRLEVSEVLEQTALILDQEKVNPNDITFEFTESAYFESEAKTKRVLSLLRDAGVQVAVDDFGTGCASFLYLKEQYFDILKIDRAFIINIEQDSSNHAIVSALVSLAKEVGLEVVAEGVETRQELDALTSLGVDYIQGYYFSKPKPIEELELAENYCAWPADVTEEIGETIDAIASTVNDYLDPSNHLSMVYEYFRNDSVQYCPIVDEKKCVGVVTRNAMNLHLTPNMGTDLETSKEHASWSKTANRMMNIDLVELYWKTPLSHIDELLNEQQAFPWVLVDEHEHYKGLVTMPDVFQYLKSQRR